MSEDQPVRIDSTGLAAPDLLRCVVDVLRQTKDSRPSFGSPAAARARGGGHGGAVAIRGGSGAGCDGGPQRVGQTRPRVYDVHDDHGPAFQEGPAGPASRGQDRLLRTEPEPRRVPGGEGARGGRGPRRSVRRRGAQPLRAADGRPGSGTAPRSSALGPQDLSAHGFGGMASADAAAASAASSGGVAMYDAM